MKIIIKRKRKYIIRNLILILLVPIAFYYLYFFKIETFEILFYGIIFGALILFINSIVSGFFRVPSFGIVITEKYIRIPGKFLEWNEIENISIFKIKNEKIIGITTKELNLSSVFYRYRLGFDVMISDQFEKPLNEIYKIILKNFHKY